MSEQKQDKLTHITGNLGSDPVERETAKGKVVNLFVIVTLRYGEDQVTQPVNLAIWDRNPELQAWAMKLSKGNAIAAEGWLRTDRVYNDKKQFDMTVVRIGRVEWAKRGNSGQKQETKAAASEDLGGAEW